MDGRIHPFVQDTSDAFFDATLTPEERAAQRAWHARTETLYQSLADTNGTAPHLRRLEGMSLDAWLQRSSVTAASLTQP